MLNRYLRRLAPRASALDHLAHAIHVLLQSGGSGDPFFLSHGLELLVRHLGASQATLVMVSGATAETRWWFPEGQDESPPAPIPSCCEWLLEHPERTLVVRDMESGPQASALGELPAPAPKALLGCAMRQGDGVRALVFAFFDEPRAFTRAEFALLEAVAGFIGRALEIEDLKQSLHRLEDALAITQAVMADSSTLDGETDLPNLRYLEIWQRAMLGSEHRSESLVVAEFPLAVRSRKDVSRLRKAAEGVRAGDLILRMDAERFMVIFQHTPRSLAHILLLRLRTQLACGPMGATLWIPGREGQGLESCRARLEAALEESRAMDQPALVWRLPEELREDAAPRKRGGKTRPEVPQRWEPPILG